MKILLEVAQIVELEGTTNGSRNPYFHQLNFVLLLKGRVDGYTSSNNAGLDPPFTTFLGKNCSNDLKVATCQGLAKYPILSKFSPRRAAIYRIRMYPSCTTFGPIMEIKVAD